MKIMKIMIAAPLALGLALTVVGSPLYAEEKAEEEAAETITGTVICLGCTLKKGAGAKAQCSVYGHKNAIKTEDGAILTILENDQSTKLINDRDYAGKKVEIKGRKFPDAGVVQVDSFTVTQEAAPGGTTKKKCK